MSRLQRPAPLPRGWGGYLPQPADYYQARIKGLGAPGSGGIAQAPCPLHADDGTSLSVNLFTGHWHCLHCGRGVLIGFHQRLTGLDWTDAVRDLIKGRA